MSEKAIVDRIISDAEQEARKIIEDAENKASVAVGEASLRAERNRIGTQAEIDARVKGIFDGQAASARLDGLKIALGERRAVIDEIYARALGLLVALDKPTALYLAEKLLKAYADDGDEIIFAENYRYAQDVMKLPVVKEKNLKQSSKTAKIDGGFTLCGVNSDKNLSYGSLLSADREERQAEIALQIFN